MHHTHLSNLPPIQMFFLIAVLFISLAVYFYPTIHAIRRNSPHTTAVVILNLFFGFTLIGWIVALVLASKQPPQVVVVYNTPPPPRAELTSGPLRSTGITGHDERQLESKR